MKHAACTPQPTVFLNPINALWTSLVLQDVVALMFCSSFVVASGSINLSSIKYRQKMNIQGSLFNTVGDVTLYFSTPFYWLFHMLGVLSWNNAQVVWCNDKLRLIELSIRLAVVQDSYCDDMLRVQTLTGFPLGSDWVLINNHWSRRTKGGALFLFPSHSKHWLHASLDELHLLTACFTDEVMHTVKVLQGWCKFSSLKK